MTTPLSQTSALVLICDKKQSYQSPKSKEFLSHLDLSKGQEMYNKIQHLRPHLDEVIPNRKFLIHNYIREILRKSPQKIQVLTMACGWDPILVKMSEEFPKHSFFGVDSESIKIQEQLIQKISPQANIFYINADITNSEQLLKNLLLKGWNKDQASCILLEGISYYIEPQKFWRTLHILKENIKSNCFICGDFLVDWTRQKISTVSKNLATTIFDMIKKDCFQNYYSYTSQDIQKNLSALNFSQIQFFTQDEIQKQRTESPLPWNSGEGHIQLFTARHLKNN